MCPASNDPGWPLDEVVAEWRLWSCAALRIRIIHRVKNLSSGGSMLRTLLETAAVVLLIALGLEVMHYRNAVLDANVDRNRAWKTVVDLRRSCADGKRIDDAELAR